MSLAHRHKDVPVQGTETTADRISRETLQQLQFLQEQINLFHGYRQLWAEAVANGRPLLISREALEREQTKTISIIAYAALELHQTVFPGRSPHARFVYQSEQPDED